MPEQTPADPSERSIALLISNNNTGLNVRHSHVPADDVHQIRQRIVTLRLGATSLPVGERVDAVVVIGRPERRPIVARLNTTPANVDELWGLVEELGR